MAPTSMRPRGLAVTILMLGLLASPLLGEEKKAQTAKAPDSAGEAAKPAAPPGPPPAKVRAGVATVQMMQDRREVVGRLVQVRQSIVAAEQDGRVVEITVDTGDRVVGGKTVLARIDDVWTKLDLAAARSRLIEAEAAVHQAQAVLEQSQRNQKFLEELAVNNSAKPKEVDDSRAITAADTAKLEATRAAVVTAQSQVAIAEEAMRRVVVIAPFDGVVVRKLTELGQWVSRGTSIVELISVGEIDAVIDAPERLVDSITVGQPATVTIVALKQEVTGKIISVSPLGSTAARTFPVKIRLDDQGGKLLAGMSVMAMVPTGPESQMLTVPRDAVSRNDLGAVVWTNLGGTVLPLRVRVLFGVGDRFAVEPLSKDAASGPQLNAGMQVVIEGAERLYPGQNIVVIPEPGAPAPEPAPENAPKPAPAGK